MEQWEELECMCCEFGDIRLNKRMGKILHSFYNSPKDSIPTSCQTWDKTIGVYRFMDNDKVTYDSILQGHIKASIEELIINSVIQVIHLGVGFLLIQLYCLLPIA